MADKSDLELEDRKQELLKQYVEQCNSNLINEINSIQTEQIRRKNQKIRQIVENHS